MPDASPEPLSETLKRMPDGFYHRGAEVTRLEAFVDASFAFALSLLAISGNTMPNSTAALLLSLKGVPAFAASFLLLIQFWRAHAGWSRRYGLDDPRSQWLSLLLIFLLLIFVYPLHMVFSSFFALLSGGALPQKFDMQSLSGFRALFVTFGVAFFSMGMVITLLYANALKQAASLRLTAREQTLTKLIVRQWAVIPMVSMVSIILAIFLPESLRTSIWIGLPGYLYFVVNGFSIYTYRKIRRVNAQMANDNATGS